MHADNISRNSRWPWNTFLEKYSTIWNYDSRLFTGDNHQPEWCHDSRSRNPSVQIRSLANDNISSNSWLSPHTHTHTQTNLACESAKTAWRHETKCSLPFFCKKRNRSFYHFIGFLWRLVKQAYRATSEQCPSWMWIEQNWLRNPYTLLVHMLPSPKCFSSAIILCGG